MDRNRIGAVLFFEGRPEYLFHHNARLVDHLFNLQIQRLCMYKQIELFQGTRDLIVAKVGPTEADKFFQEAKYVVALGSNDFINNYLMPVYSDSWTYNDQSYITYLMETLQDQLTVLVKLISNIYFCACMLHSIVCILCRFSSFSFPIDLDFLDFKKQSELFENARMHCSCISFGELFSKNC